MKNMRDKIVEILELVKNNKFEEALTKCEIVKANFKENVEFLHIYGFVLFNLKNYRRLLINGIMQ